MHIGQWLIADATTIKVFSPWFPRGGDNAIFTYEKIVEVNSPTFDIEVVAKSKDDPGNGTTQQGSWTQVSGTSFYTREVTDCEELIRFQFELTGSESAAMILYRMLAPTWFDDAQ